jgi:hypothetical protein
MGSAHYIKTRAGAKGLEVLFMEEITEADSSRSTSQPHPPFEKVVRNVAMTSPRTQEDIFRSFNSLGKWCLPIHTLNTTGPIAVVECRIGNAKLFVDGDSRSYSRPVTASGEPFMMLSPTYYVDSDGPKMSFIEFRTETPVDRTSIYTIDLSERP